jgi:hypothetical protein
LVALILVVEKCRQKTGKIMLFSTAKKSRKNNVIFGGSHKNIAYFWLIIFGGQLLPKIAQCHRK